MCLSGLAWKYRLASYLESSCLSLLGARSTNISYHSCRESKMLIETLTSFIIFFTLCLIAKGFLEFLSFEIFCKVLQGLFSHFLCQYLTSGSNYLFDNGNILLAFIKDIKQYLRN